MKKEIKKLYTEIDLVNFAEFVLTQKKLDPECDYVTDEDMQIWKMIKDEKLTN